MADERVTLTIDVDVSRFTTAIGQAATVFSKAFADMAMTAERAAVQIAALQGTALNWVAFDEAARWRRRQRRYRTHVFEAPRGSRMHASYRAKTRRRNRRG